MNKLPHTLSATDRHILDNIRNCLSLDLLTASERKKIEPGSHPVTGHCFVATHAAYHLIGKQYGFVPYWCYIDGGGTHWWLWNTASNEFIDPTFEQVSQPFPYNEGRLCLLYTKRHKRTERLIHLVKEALAKI